jgi:hypothetical protein
VSQQGVAGAEFRAADDVITIESRAVGDQAGVYRVGPVHPDTDSLHVRAPSYGEAHVRLQHRIRSDEEVVVQLGRCGDVVGTVRPVPARPARVQALRAGGVFTAPIDAEGGFRFESLSPDHYRFIVRDTGYSSDVVDVVLGAGEIKRIALQLEETIQLSGSVTTTSGEAVTETDLAVVDSAGAITFARSDAHGRLSIEVPRGPTSLFRLSGLASQERGASFLAQTREAGVVWVIDTALPRFLATLPVTGADKTVSLARAVLVAGQGVQYLPLTGWNTGPDGMVWLGAGTYVLRGDEVAPREFSVRAGER